MQGVTVFSSVKPGLLEWGGDNRIRLYALDATTHQATGILLDCAPQEIKKFTVSNGFKIEGNLKTPYGTFRLTFDKGGGGEATLAQAAGQALDMIVPAAGFAGLAASTAIMGRAAQQEQSSDILWWKENLSKFGVGGINMSASSMYKLDSTMLKIFGIFFGVLLVIVIIVLIAAAARG